jgi:Flp pilus assembly protein TadG
MTRRSPPDLRPATFLRDEAGATLVEFAVVISLFLFVFFGLIDFGRLAYHVVMSERSMHAAARVAIVRPPVCAGVPQVVSLSSSAPASTDYGTSCAIGGICESPGTITCLGDADNATAAEIWSQVQPTLPGDTDITNLRFTYSYDARLSFLGGPYVPVVTVELEDVNFVFVTPLAALARMILASPGGSSLGPVISMPGMSVSLPGEDLSQGENG